MAFEHGTARKQTGQVTRAVSKPDVATDPDHIVGDITDQAAALRDDFHVVSREEFLEYRAAARKEPMGMATLRHALARRIGCRKCIAFEHGDDSIEIRQYPGGQKPTHASADHDRMFAQFLHDNPPVQSVAMRPSDHRMQAMVGLPRPLSVPRTPSLRLASPWLCSACGRLDFRRSVRTTSCAIWPCAKASRCWSTWPKRRAQSGATLSLRCW